MSDLSPREVADQFGISRSAVYRLIESGQLVAYKARGRIRVEPSEARAFKERNQVAPARAPASPMFAPSERANGTFLAELRTMGRTR